MLVAPFVLADCKCHAPDKEETTHWGGNEMIVMKEENSYRQLRGTIEMSDGSLLKDALVEVFDHPDYLLDSSHSRREGPPEQKRVAVCRTAADGKFCFRNLPPGKYELRSSLGSGWNVTHVYVVLDGQSKRGGELKVLMLVGT
jgi:protocatechuate 3,4-dioxygenase beta subunit